MTALVRDLRLAVRVLLHTKSWTLVVLVSLALGIGANTALFTAVNGLLLQTVPVHEPDRLVRFNWAGKNDMVRSSSGYGYSGTSGTRDVRVDVLVRHVRGASGREHDLDRPGRGRADGRERHRGRRRAARQRLSGLRQLLRGARRPGGPGPRVRRRRRHAERAARRGHQPCLLAEAVRRPAVGDQSRRVDQRPDGHHHRRDATGLHGDPAPRRRGAGHHRAAGVRCRVQSAAALARCQSGDSRA